jgi:hypothetical protein
MFPDHKNRFVAQEILGNILLSQGHHDVAMKPLRNAGRKPLNQQLFISP